MPFKAKPKAYKEYPESGTICPYYSEIIDIYRRKSDDITYSDYRTIDPNIIYHYYKIRIYSIDKDKRPICLRPEEENILRLYNRLSIEEAETYSDRIII